MNFTQAEENYELRSHESTTLAIISNSTLPPEKPDYVKDLKSVDISETEFLQLFYNFNTNHFHINSSNKFSNLISLKDKFFVSKSNQLIPFNYNYLILSKLAEKNSSTNNSLSALNKLTALKGSTNIQSLAHVRGFQQALTWDEAVALLLTSNIIKNSTNPLSVAQVDLVVQFIYVEHATNLSLAINYHYNVAIPGYSNVNNDAPTTFTYSKDEVQPKKPREKIFAPIPVIKSDHSYIENSIHDDDDTDDNSEQFSASAAPSKFSSDSTASSAISFVENHPDDDDESLGLGSITNSIMQQIKLVQQDSSSEGDNESLNDDASTWA
jgi:hypothetical protein